MNKLVYNGCFRWWEIQDGMSFLWMKDATFQHYVSAYLQEQGITKPTRQQRCDAVQHCRAASYWDVGNNDIHCIGPSKRQ